MVSVGFIAFSYASSLMTFLQDRKFKSRRLFSGLWLYEKMTYLGFQGISEVTRSGKIRRPIPVAVRLIAGKSRILRTAVPAPGPTHQKLSARKRSIVFRMHEEASYRSSAGHTICDLNFHKKVRVVRLR